MCKSISCSSSSCFFSSKRIYKYSCHGLNGSQEKIAWEKEGSVLFSLNKKTVKFKRVELEVHSTRDPGFILV